MADDVGGGEGQDDQQQQVSGGREEGGKPDFVNEKFWNPDTKAVDIEGLSRSYDELGTKIREKTEDTRQTIIGELENDRLAKRPQTADDYEVKIPDDLRATMGDDMEFNFVDGDPMMTFWKEFSFEQGYDQATFESGISAYITSSFASMPVFEDEIKALGDHGRDRAMHVAQWASKNLSEQSYTTLESFATTADGIKALEEIMQNQGEPTFSPGGSAGLGSSVTLNELRQMQADPRYWDPTKREPEFIRKVDKGYEDLVAAG